MTLLWGIFSSNLSNWGKKNHPPVPFSAEEFLHVSSSKRFLYFLCNGNLCKHLWVNWCQLDVVYICCWGEKPTNKLFDEKRSFMLKRRKMHLTTQRQRICRELFQYWPWGRSSPPTFLRVKSLQSPNMPKLISITFISERHYVQIRMQISQ